MEAINVWHKVILCCEDRVLDNELPSESVLRISCRGSSLKSGVAWRVSGRSGRMIEIMAYGIEKKNNSYADDLGRSLRVSKSTLVHVIQVPLIIGASLRLSKKFHFQSQNTTRLKTILSNCFTTASTENIIMVSGPNSTGKTTSLHNIANELGVALVKPSLMQASLIRCDDDDRVFERIIQMAIHASPSLLLIDHAELWFPMSSNSETTFSQQLLKKSKTLRQEKVVLVLVTHTPASVDTRVRNICSFECVFQLPSPEERALIFQSWFHTLLSQSEMSNGASQKISEYGLVEQSHGSSHGDIFRILESISLSDTTLSSRSQGNNDPIKQLLLKMFNQVPKQTVLNIQPLRSKVAWSDVGGLESVKRDLTESVVWVFERRDRLKFLGIKPPVGVLMVGPPGTGKTLLAKAVASRCNATMFSIRIPDVMKAELGESERTIQSIFQNARVSSPSIIFIDEIQAIFGTREADSHIASNLVSQLVHEMDRISLDVNNHQGISILAATNLPEVMDAALFSPGRFEKVIFVPPPENEERFEILSIHLRSIPIDFDAETTRQLSDKLFGYTGAEIQGLCRQAGLCALRRNVETELVTYADFLEAMRLCPSQTNPLRVEILKQWVRLKNGSS
eukprot:TRINITY_DN3884_c0_g1_i5.p1 TRINITY_DN3884_c0_g1~~TRINITY_DN3884_c0_g1_i5.p1  ORF type:complete len:630 (+),score=103.10 TRINITY_DN3884_c0_g1_i5:23-1891(+)